MFTDDTELYNSAPRSSTDSLFCNMQNCVSDRKKWTIHKFHLNEDKTEALLFGPTKSSNLPDVLRIGQNDIPFCYSARNLGVMFDSGLTMKQQVDRICQTACSEIRRIGSICHFLTTEATKILGTSLVLSCLEYRSSQLAGIPQKLLNKVQHVINCAARLVCKAPQREHVTPLLVDLRWLPVECRIECKIATTRSVVLLLIISLMSSNYIPHHALSAPLLTLHLPYSEQM